MSISRVLVSQILTPPSGAVVMKRDKSSPWVSSGTGGKASCFLGYKAVSRSCDHQLVFIYPRTPLSPLYNYCLSGYRFITSETRFLSSTCYHRATTYPRFMNMILAREDYSLVCTNRHQFQRMQSWGQADKENCFEKKLE